MRYDFSSNFLSPPSSLLSIDGKTKKTQYLNSGNLIAGKSRYYTGNAWGIGHRINDQWTSEKSMIPIDTRWPILAFIVAIERVYIHLPKQLSHANRVSHDR